MRVYLMFDPNRLSINRFILNTLRNIFMIGYIIIAYQANVSILFLLYIMNILYKIGNMKRIQIV